MNKKVISSMFLLATLAACDQDNQELPFGSEVGKPQEKTITTEGGVLTSAAGGSLNVPSGALQGSTTLAITPIASLGIPYGQSASNVSFRLEPTNLRLNEEARIEVRVTESAQRRGDSWLTTLVNTTEEGSRALTNTSVDISNGIVRSDIDQLGTVTAVIPDANAVVVAQEIVNANIVPSSDHVGAGVTRRVGIECGAVFNRPCNNLQVQVSRNLLEYAKQAALIYPEIRGFFTITGGRVSGRVEFRSDLRAKVSNSVATTVPADIVIEPTAGTIAVEQGSQLTITNVRIRARSGDNSFERIENVVFTTHGAEAVVFIEREVEFTNTSNQRDRGRVRVKLFLQREGL